MLNRKFMFLFLVFTFSLFSLAKLNMRGARSSDTTMGIVEELELTIVYDNNPYDERLETEWGFGCYINADDTTILFDTGGDAEILLDNMGELNLDIGEIDVIVLSHIHGDHVGGLFGVLDLNSNVTVYLPVSFPDEFKSNVSAYGCEVIEVEDPQKICNGVSTTGELGITIMEQSLIIATTPGLVVITGCAHPGVVNIVEESLGLTDLGIYLVVGGFHLNGVPAFIIDNIIDQLKTLEVQKVAPCHCSGNLARQQFKLEFDDDYIEAGVGWSIHLPLFSDMNFDLKIDMRDISIAAWAIGSYPTHPRWDSYADINEDGRLDMKDLVIIARNFGKTYS